MRMKVAHILGIDQALAKGCSLTLHGKDWTFSPLTFRDEAEIVSFRKSKALKEFWVAAEECGIDPKKRLAQINAILNRAATEDDFKLTDPEVLLLKLRLSLKRQHPDVTDDDVLALLGLEGETLGEASYQKFQEAVKPILDVMAAMDFGPLDPRKILEEGKEPDQNPPVENRSA